MNQHQQVEVQYLDPVPGLNPQDVVGLGAELASAGFTILESRALIAKFQQMAMQMAMQMAPEMMEQVRKIQEARLMAMYTQIRLLTPTLGFVSRDRVLSIITNVSASTPRS